MVAKRWRMTTKKGKGLRTFPQARPCPMPLSRASSKIPEQKHQAPLPHSHSHPAEGQGRGENAERTTEMQQLGEGRLGFLATEKAGGALITVLKGMMVGGPASPLSQPAQQVKELEALLVGSSFRQVVEESGNRGVG